MNTELKNLYLKFRKHSPFMLVGHKARLALDAAKTLIRFRELEADGLVRMRCEPETENYFDVYGREDSAKHQKQTEDIIERLGCWWTVSEFFNGEEWEHADSCGMHTGYNDPLSPFENCYVIDEMRAAINAADLLVETANQTLIAEAMP